MTTTGVDTIPPMIKQALDEGAAEIASLLQSQLFPLIQDMTPGLDLTDGKLVGVSNLDANGMSITIGLEWGSRSFDPMEMAQRLIAEEFVRIAVQRYTQRSQNS